MTNFKFLRRTLAHGGEFAFLYLNLNAVPTNWIVRPHDTNSTSANNGGVIYEREFSFSNDAVVALSVWASYLWLFFSFPALFTREPPPPPPPPHFLLPPGGQVGDVSNANCQSITWWGWLVCTLPCVSCRLCSMHFDPHYSAVRSFSCLLLCSLLRKIKPTPK